jgi:UDP-GlcNAc3NAcA epimerase
MHKIVAVVGARPQFVKAAAVSRAFAEYNAGQSAAKRLQHIIVHTGQHYDDNLSQIFFDELEIPVPAYNLGIGSDSHGAQTGAMLKEIERVLETERPAVVLTYGDTNSTLAATLAAVKIHIPAVHVEAGLRSFNRAMPEEINRVVADELSTLLFCPTPAAVSNLGEEGIPPASGSVRQRNVQQVLLVGDVMHDALLFYRRLSERKSRILSTLGLEPGNYCLATLHRAENTDEPSRLRGIMDALATIACNSLPVVLPVHPRTRKLLKEHRVTSAGADKLRQIDPVGYLDMVKLEAGARVILTDSGGVQKESHLLGVPCVTLRDETEWVESVATGWNRLAGASQERILAAYAAASAWGREDVPYPDQATSHETVQSLYGDGTSASKIVSSIARFITEGGAA